MQCVNRLYDLENRTFWFEQLYGAQIAIYESILGSSHRTLNGDEADFFYVPVLDSCIYTRAGNALHMQSQDGLRSYLALEFYKKAYDHIVLQYPYWNQSSGRDHIWFFSWDEGACCAPKEIWNSTMLVHWGNTNSKHNGSTTAYWSDKWDKIPVEKRGDHACYDPTKDIVLPAWKTPNAGTIQLGRQDSLNKARATLFYFNGNLGPAYTGGRPEDTYSMGIRQRLAKEFASTPDKNGKLGTQHNPVVVVTPIRSDNYGKELANSIFCGVLPGDGWSGRMEDSVLHGCIPVIIQDGIFMPFENVLNYESFAIRVKEDDIPNLVEILKSFNDTEIKLMLENINNIWHRFLYRDTVLLEAERQKGLFAHEDGWAREFSTLGNDDDDDVFATFIQVLHYKLYNDPWRKDSRRRAKTGLPQACL